MNEREDLIITYLASSDGAVERAEPGHYSITDLMDMGDGTAAPELTAKIEAHCKECPGCRARIEASRLVLLRGEDLAMLPLEGSLLEFAVTPPVPRPRPQPAPTTELSSESP
jgi:hypothetical protein